MQFKISEQILSNIISFDSKTYDESLPQNKKEEIPIHIYFVAVGNRGE